MHCVGLCFSNTLQNSCLAIIQHFFNLLCFINSKSRPFTSYQRIKSVNRGECIQYYRFESYLRFRLTYSSILRKLVQIFIVHHWIGEKPNLADQVISRKFWQTENWENVSTRFRWKFTKHTKFSKNCHPRKILSADE